MLQPLAYEMMLQGIRTIDGQQAEQLIADPLQQVSTTLAPYDFLQSVQNASGLLLERERSIYSFAHKTFQEYLAAVYISKHGLLQILTAHVQDEWWHETIRLYCAQAEATPLVQACLNISSIETLILALGCAREALSLQATVQRRVEDVIAQGIEGNDPERQRITAEALLTRRLHQMYALNELTFIDSTLVTHAEYQLFLNELHAQGKRYPPDHWAHFTFSAGQGQQPVLGVRHSDAQAFCTWLSERAGGAWRYRLPNEKDLAQADQSIWKNFSQNTGYWIEGEQRFTSSQGQPSASLWLLFLTAFNRAMNLAPALYPNHVPEWAIGRDHDYDLAIYHNRDRDQDHHIYLTYLAFNHDVMQAFHHGLDPDFPDLISDLDRAIERDRTLDLVHTSDPSLVRDSSLVQALYIQLFLLQERRAQRLPAWEGILLVKEQILDE